MADAGSRRRHHQLRSEVLDKRPLESRPGWGVLVMRNTGTNQDGALVFEFEGAIFVERRGDP